LTDRLSATTDLNKFKGRTWHIVAFMAVIFSSGISCGYGLAYTNNSMPVINAIFGWNTDKQQSKWDSLFGCIFTLGACFGSNIAGRIIR